MDESQIAAFSMQYGLAAEDQKEPERRALATRCLELRPYLESDLLRSTAVSLMQQEQNLAGHRLGAGQ